MTASFSPWEIEAGDMIKKLIFPLLLWTASSAFASFNFTLSPSLETTPQGGVANPDCFIGSAMCVLLSGTVTNLDAVNEIDFTSLVVTWDPLSASTTALVNNDGFFIGAWFTSDGAFGFPAFLDGGASFTGVLFEIDVPPLFIGDTPAPFGQYFGTATVNAVDLSNNPFQVAQPFEIDLVPEPSTWVLMLIGLSSVAVVARKRRRASVRA
jgi:hypothetical protein